jgi:hypothetical protein
MRTQSIVTAVGFGSQTTPRKVLALSAPRQVNLRNSILCRLPGLAQTILSRVRWSMIYFRWRHRQKSDDGRCAPVPKTIA